MTQKTTNNGLHNIPKKWWIVGLCSFSMLGGLAAYGYHTSTQPTKSEAKTETVDSFDKGKELKKTWEKQIRDETKQNEESKPKTKSSVDKILNVLTGENNEDSSSIFGFKMAKAPNRQLLIGQLAEAIDKQETIEQEREIARKDRDNKKSLLSLVDKPISLKNETSDLLKPVLSNKKPEITLPEVPDKPVIDEEKPDNPEVPTFPENPSIPVIPDNPDIPIEPTPDPVPTPDPEPIPPVTPEEPDNTLDQLITTNKLALTTVKNKAEQLNQSLNQVKNELENLATIEGKTTKNEEQATKEWQKVADLVDEYNRLSQEIKKLIETDGQVLPINYELYRETYEQLNQKVSEIKKAQKQANQTTNQMIESVHQAQETANRLPEIEEHYQELQTQVSTTKNEIETTVSNAQSNEQVANAVQEDITQTIQTSESLDTTNQAVENQLEEIQQTDYQSILEQVNQNVETVKNESTLQNNVINAVLDDFQSLPTLEDTEVPSKPETDPETSEMTDLLLSGQNQSETSMSSEIVDHDLREESSSDNAIQIDDGEIL